MLIYRSWCEISGGSILKDEDLDTWDLQENISQYGAMRHNLSRDSYLIFVRGGMYQVWVQSFGTKSTIQGFIWRQSCQVN